MWRRFLRSCPVFVVAVSLGCSGSEVPADPGSDYGADVADVADTVDVPWNSLNRPQDPIVMKAGDVPFAVAGMKPEDVVAFRFTDSWDQVPVQVDERDLVEYGRVYGGYSADVNPTAKSYGMGVYEEFYTDAGTFTGPDSDPTLDDDDEIVFMARDSGSRAEPWSEPPGVLPGSGVEVRIRDPLDGGEGFVYLFARDGSLDPAAGEDYVDYGFVLLDPDGGEADYRTGYDIKGGADHGQQRNPEDSSIKTGVYERHWSFRWTCDGLRIGEGTGEDILEKRDYWIIPGVCERFNGTFNAGEGCFVTNTDGPVRAIRSYMGANSGPLTQGTHVYYEGREDFIVDLRVHERPSGGVLYMDYSEAAFGMTYSNNRNEDGVLIDGKRDDVKAGPLTWEMVTGEQGSLVLLHDLETDDPAVAQSVTSFYRDEMDSELPQCQACWEGCDDFEIISDPHMIGASGPWMLAAVPNSDPRKEPYVYVHNLRTTYYGPPGFTVEDAKLRRAWVSNPLVAEASAFSAP